MAVVAPAVAIPRCPTKCGSVDIPYPFGIGDECSLPGFDITCNTSFTPWKPFLGEGNIEVLEINSTDGLIRINQLIAQDCYGAAGSGRSWIRPFMDIAGRPYKFSDQNRFVAIGCDTVGYLIDGTSDQTARFSTGCASLCTNSAYIENGTCSGVGCCETPLPKGLQSYHIRIESYYNHTGCWNFSPCSFAFVAESKNFTNFSTSSFKDLREMERYPVMLEWSIGTNTCPLKGEYSACIAQNSDCYNTTNVAGYRCKCSDGYTGNPYRTDGCIDINECESANLCTWKCLNIPGKYNCSCPENMDVDVDGHKCICKAGTQTGELTCEPTVSPRSVKFPLSIVVIGCIAILIFLSANIVWSYWALRKKKLIKLKEKFFQQNGGSLLAKQMSQTDGANGMMKIFSSRELIEATDNFAEYRVLGKGGFGTVYKGILPDGRVVAVKKSKISNEEQNEQFINEGTFGYVDPEYFQSGVFTEKSDVYSFGVILVELLTGQKAVLLNRVPGNGNLAGYFISYYNENRIEEIYEDRVRDEGHKDRLLAVVEVAIRCLSVKRNERPTMKEVSKDLEELMFTKHLWAKEREEEVEPLLMKPFLYDPESFNISTSFSGESSKHSALPFNLMR